MGEEAAEMASQMPKHGEFCWTEFASTDISKCRPFYENVFGWQFNKSESTGEEMEYLEFSSSGESYPDGAIYQIQPEMWGGNTPPAHISLYISVDNVDESIEKAKQLGATIGFGPYDIPNVGRMAVVTDPTGANFAMITLAAM